MAYKPPKQSDIERAAILAALANGPLTSFQVLEAIRGDRDPFTLIDNTRNHMRALEKAGKITTDRSKKKSSSRQNTWSLVDSVVVE